MRYGETHVVVRTITSLLVTFYTLILFVMVLMLTGHMFVHVPVH